jgi:2'-5' RNA ligase
MTTTPLARRLSVSSSLATTTMPSSSSLTYTQTNPSLYDTKIAPLNRRSKTVPILSRSHSSTYLPLPYVKPPPSPSRKLKPFPPPILPSRPEPARWHYRNELQRRVSPTSGTFRLSPTNPGFPFESRRNYPATAPTSPTMGMTNGEGFTPVDTLAGKEYSTNAYQRPSTDGAEETVYILTLKTSDQISNTMQSLRRKWFPQQRNKVPAHLTLFHALPGSRIVQISQSLEKLTRRTRHFNVATGHIQKGRSGVFVNVGEGEEEVKRVFGEVRDQFFESLSIQDRSFKGHWTVMNKENDSKRVEDAYRDVERSGTVKGTAQGLVLWRYEKDGTWSYERDFEFLQNEERSEDGSVVDVEVARFL